MKKSIFLVIALVMVVALCACSEKQDLIDNQDANVTTAPDLGIETVAQESSIDTFVEEYNISANNKLVFNEEFIVSNSQSNHYRTEFRLPAYEDAIGKSYNLNDLVVDIISTEDYFGNVDIRVYVDSASLEQLLKLHLRCLIPL